MKERKGKLSTGIIALLILVTTVCLVIAGYAFAKYAQVFVGGASGTVARWSFKVNGSNDNASSFNLENTITENDGVIEGKIAPGSSGYFDVNIDASGTETAVNYIISALVENKPQNMHFYIDENKSVELGVIDNQIVINDFIPVQDVNTPKLIRIYWDWPIQTGNTEEERFKNDIIDTESVGKSFNVDMNVTGIQVQPDSGDASFTVNYYLENANDSNYTLYTSRIYSQNVTTDVTLSNLAIDIEDGKYAFGTTSAVNGGTTGNSNQLLGIENAVSNATISEDGNTVLYLYYARDRYTLTTLAGENIGKVTSTGLSTGTSNDVTITTDNGERNFEQPKTTMTTKYKCGESINLVAENNVEDGYTYTFRNWSASPIENIEDGGDNNTTTNSNIDLGANYNPTQQQTTIIMPKQDVQIIATADKNANTYTVIFDNNNGIGTMEQQAFTYDQTQALTQNVYTKQGYNFKNWNTRQDGTGTSYDNEQQVKNLVSTANGTITLYAQWSANQYEIIFDANGGTGTMPAQIFKYDESQAITENTLTRTGYTFTGWNLAIDGSDTNYANNEHILNLTSENNAQITVYAQWSANNYVVEFDANGGTGSMQNQTFTYDVAKTLRPNEFSKTGYTFAGWAKTQQDANSELLINLDTTTDLRIAYTDRQEVSNLAPNGTIRLYAVWTKNTYTITYNSNNGTGTMDNSVFQFDVTNRLSQNTFTRTGYRFAGWNTAANGSGTDYTNQAEIRNLTDRQNGNIILYAKWNPNTYNVNFNKNTGNGHMDSVTYTYDITANLPENTFTKTGYTFIGWGTEESIANQSSTITEKVVYNNKQEIVNLVETNDEVINLYAIWEPNTNTSYQVTHYVMNTQGLYVISEIENLTGTTDSEIAIQDLVKTTRQYNVENGIYLEKVIVNSTQLQDIGQTATATINPDGTTQIDVFYARTYGYLTTIAGNNITDVTRLSHIKYYYGETLQDITATIQFEQGYLTNFEKWESSNISVIPDITSNPIRNYTWPAMPEGSEVTLTAKATKVESNETPYTVNYYLENADDDEYTLYTTNTYAGTTNSVITIEDVDINLANCTISESDITTSTTISGDGTTSVNIYYARNKYDINLIGSENITEIKLITQQSRDVDDIIPLSINKSLKWGQTADIYTTVEELEGYTYEFTGWEVSGNSGTIDLGVDFDSTKKITTITMPAQPITINVAANKQANNYNVSFNANGGNGIMANQTIEYDAETNLNANEFTRNGYTFYGWSTDASAEAKVYDVMEYSGVGPQETGKYTNFKRYDIKAPFIEGEVYQLDYDAKGSGKLTNYFYGPDGYLEIANGKSSQGFTSKSYDGYMPITLTNEYQHYTVRYTLGSEGDENLAKYILFRVFSGNSATVKNIQLFKVTSNINAYVNNASVKNMATNGTLNLYAMWKDITAPQVAIETTKTTNEITVNAAATETGSGLTNKFKFYIGTKNESNKIIYNEPIEVTLQTGSTQANYTFEGLQANTHYYIKVESEDNAGNIGTQEKEVITNVLDGQINFTDRYWSNGRYILKLNTNAINENGEIYDIQYQVLTAEQIAQGEEFNENENWSNSLLENNTIISLKDGDKLYTRIYDGVNGGETTYNYDIVNPAEKMYTEEQLSKIAFTPTTSSNTTFQILTNSIGTNNFNVNIEKEITNVETYNYYAKANNEDKYTLISTSTNWDDVANITNEMLAELKIGATYTTQSLEGNNENIEENSDIQENYYQLKENETYKVKVVTRSSDGKTMQSLNTATIITSTPAVTGTSYSNNKTYIDSEKHTAVIPAGFSVSTNNTENVISKGMVLKDGNNNEFVWVPVDNAIYVTGGTAIPTSTSSITTYYKPMAINQTEHSESYESIVYNYSGVKSYRNTSSTGIGKSGYREPSLLTTTTEGYTWDLTDSAGKRFDAESVNYLNTLGFSSISDYGNYINNSYTNMVKSTNNFGGFYIGRYETSLNGDTVQSKSGQTPMSQIDWYNLYKNQDSNRNENNPYYSVNSVTSSMIWGSQYDSMLNWILTGTEKSKLQATINGNKTNLQSLTGQYSNDIINNIYDLSANTYEWTQEAYSYNYRVFRGSCFDNGKTENPTAKGITIHPEVLGLAYGSRLALYINISGDTTAPVVEITEENATANSVKVRVTSHESGSGISKYYYSISTDGENWDDGTIGNTFESYSHEYTFTGLTQNTTYYIKVQAKDNAGNIGVANVKEITTESLLLEDGAIYVINMTGSSGNGVVNLGVEDNYKKTGYKIEYQVVVTDNSTTDETIGRVTQFSENGTWISSTDDNIVYNPDGTYESTLVKGLYTGDTIYARLSDGTNMTLYTTILVDGLEEFSETYSTTTLYTDENGDTAWIPAGFAVGTSESINKIENGLVVQDSLGNQFVWIPVESAIANGTTYPTSTSSTSTYKPMARLQANSSKYYEALYYTFNKTAKATSYVTASYRIGNSGYVEPRVATGRPDGYTWDLESLPEISGTTNDAETRWYKNLLKFSSVTEFGKYKNEEFTNMIKSVEEYKGFYMGRYETSVSDESATGVAQSQQGKTVLDDAKTTTSGYYAIWYQDSNINSNNPYYSSNSVTSSMLWNSQYSAMINWILKNSENKDKVFSTTLGNHKTATKPDPAGTNLDDLVNNIYDLGGNVIEVNQANGDSNNQIARGGYYYRSGSYTGNYNMIYIRGWTLSTGISTSYNVFGSRMALYLTKQSDTIKPTISKRDTPVEQTNNILFKVNASDDNSGIKKYHYYISTDGTNFTEYTGWGNSYKFEKLTPSTTYYMYATVEDKAGNISEPTETVTASTTAIDAADTILSPRVYGSNGAGYVYFDITPEYEQQGYYVEYKKVVPGGTFYPNGTWTKIDSRTVKGLSVGDTVYARVRDVNNTANVSSYRAVTITQLEEFGTPYTQTGTYTDTEGNSAYIPAGFSVGTTESINKISKGLVVQDTNGNQFVWVPVDKNSVIYNGSEIATDGSSTYKPMVQYQIGSNESTENQYFESVLYSYSKSYSTGSRIMYSDSGIAAHVLGYERNREPSLVTNSANYSWVNQSGSEYDALSTYYNGILKFNSATEFGQYMNEQYTRMVQSIKQYGGFYIGRYETSLDSTKTKVQSKINVTPTSASSSESNRWYGLYYNQDSVRNLANPYYGSTSVVSSMIWCSQYNAMLNWVLTGSDKDMVFKNTGNHSGSRKLTGTYGSDITNNIFDLSANLWEWTQTGSGIRARIQRGGGYSTSNGNIAATYTTTTTTPTYQGISIGSRLALYLQP